VASPLTTCPPEGKASNETLELSMKRVKYFFTLFCIYKNLFEMEENYEMERSSLYGNNSKGPGLSCLVRAHEKKPTPGYYEVSRNKDYYDAMVDSRSAAAAMSVWLATEKIWPLLNCPIAPGVVTYTVEVVARFWSGKA